MRVADLMKKARDLADVVLDPGFDESALTARRALESEADRRIREAYMVSDGVALLLGNLDRFGDPIGRQPCSCHQPNYEGLERQQDDGRGWPLVCENCHRRPLTKRQRAQALRAYEEWTQRSPDTTASLTHTLTEELRAGTWRCQHGRRWYVDASAGRPLLNPARQLAEGNGWAAQSCGFERRECGKEHDRRMDADVADLEPQGGYTMSWSGLTAGPAGGVIAMPFSSAYPMGAPSEVLPS